MNIIPFQFESNNIRVIEQDGEPWFVAKDVAELLGYKKSRNAISRHCKGALKHPVQTNGGIQDLTIIPEQDVFRLILRSKLPSAIKFEEWLFDEVLPTIRKKGSYDLNPYNLSRLEILKLGLEAEEEKNRLREEYSSKALRVDVYHHVVDADCFSMQ